MTEILRTYINYSPSRRYHRWEIKKQTVNDNIINEYKLSNIQYKDYPNMILGVKPEYELKYNQIIGAFLENAVYSEAIIFFENEIDINKAFQTIKQDLMENGIGPSKIINF